MASRFRFNRKDTESVVVEGERVDIMGHTLTVVDAQGHSLVSFVDSDVVAWWQLQEGPSASPINAG